MIQSRLRRCTLLLIMCATFVQAQPEGLPLGTGPWVLPTFEQGNIKVSVVARGMDHPFGLVYLPGTATSANPIGDVLLTERTGKVRLFSKGKLQKAVVVDMAKVFSMEQLFDIKLHPQFATNGLLYFTYIKTGPKPDGGKGYWVTTALARGHFTGNKIEDLKDIYVASKAWSGNIGGASSRLHFLKDGTLLFGVSHRIDTLAPQQLNSDLGKILRLKDDGSIPKDNPFIGVEGALPELYTWGNRSVMDFTTNPNTGEVWELENGPQGGDEVNILKPGNNYGWPIATYGRDYDGKRFSPQPWVEGTALPELYWVPSITVAGLTFYTGDKFPKWKDNLFVTSMIKGRVPGTGHLERVAFNENGEVRREELLNSLHQRIRYVSQGPDGLLYLLTDSKDGALLRLEPAGSEPLDAGVAGGVEVAQPATAAINMFPDLDCNTCHRVEEKLVGPSFRDIAKKYPMTNANVSLLADHIIKGSSGVWGETPMSAHEAIKADAAKAIAKKILDLESE